MDTTHKENNGSCCVVSNGADVRIVLIEVCSADGGSLVTSLSQTEILTISHTPHKVNNIELANT